MPHKPAILILDSSTENAELAAIVAGTSKDHEIIVADTFEKADHIRDSYEISAIILGETKSDEDYRSALRMISNTRRVQRNLPILFVADTVDAHLEESLGSVVNTLNIPSPMRRGGLSAATSKVAFLPGQVHERNPVIYLDHNVALVTRSDADEALPGFLAKSLHKAHSRA